MKQYLITAYDYTDPQAFDRRMAIRPKHLEGARKLKDRGNFILGGAILNEGGKMIGSTMILQFTDESELKKWMDEEPYIDQKVWERIEVKPFKVADV